MCLVFLVAHASRPSCSVAVLLLVCASLELDAVEIPTVFGFAVAASGLDKVSFVFWTAGVSSLRAMEPSELLLVSFCR